MKKLFLSLLCFSFIELNAQINTIPNFNGLNPEQKKNAIEKYLAENKNIVENDLQKAPLAEQRNFQVEDLLALKRINEFAVSPNGQWIIYTLGTPNLEKNKNFRDLYAVSIDGKNTIQLTKTDAQESTPMWFPDGKRIAYISTESGTPQIYIKEFPNGTPKQFKEILGGVDNVKLSPDAKYFSFTAEVKLLQNIVDEYPKAVKNTAMKYTNLPVRHWDSWDDDKISHLFVVASDGNSEAIDLMKGEKFDCPLKPMGGSEQYAWSSDSKSIVYTSKKVENPAFSTNSDLYLVDINSQNTVNITSENKGYDKNPVFSPDGKYIAYNRQNQDGFEADKDRLMLYDLSKKASVDLTENLDQWASNMTWSPDSKKIYFNAATGMATEAIYEINVQNKEYKVLTTGINDDNAGLAITNDSKKIIFGRTNMQRPTDIYSLDLSNYKIRRITAVNDDLLSKIKDIKIESRFFQTEDGKTLHSWVVYPHDFDAKKKYPMITYCQGGPQGTISQYFSYRWNFLMMASQGYVVLAPNRRGMPGFGQSWNDEISTKWGEGAMQDMLLATDEVSKESFIDKNKRSAVGASFGGYNVFWLAGNHKKRFNAFISHCGVFNFESMYGSTEELFFPKWEFGGTYWDTPQSKSYTQYSPHNYVKNWDTPILIIAGLNDFRVPYTQSLEAYTAAQSMGVPSELLVFEGENHWVLQLQNAYVWHNEFYNFLKKNLNK